MRMNRYGGTCFLPLLTLLIVLQSAAQVHRIPTPPRTESKGKPSLHETTPPVLLPANDGSLGEFRPDTDLILDSHDPNWKGRRIHVYLDHEGKIVGGVFNFVSIEIPSGVTVRFNGYRWAVLQSVRTTVVNGVISGAGADGGRGADGASNATSFPTTAGARGGDGGTGNAGVGNGGGGGGGSPVGADGTGPASPGRPPVFCPYETTGGGGGGIGGSNGSVGAFCADNRCGVLSGTPPFGDIRIPDAPLPSGGGSGGEYEYGLRSTVRLDVGRGRGRRAGGGGATST
jgi:hypothetical protein